ncbi:MAG: hypothetical protein QNJ64_01675 [Crocosphaera sp.]|nr:hypothetical protein [Crocosphaera sp.]
MINNSATLEICNSEISNGNNCQDSELKVRSIKRSIEGRDLILAKLELKIIEESTKGNGESNNDGNSFKSRQQMIQDLFCPKNENDSFLFTLKSTNFQGTQWQDKYKKEGDLINKKLYKNNICQQDKSSQASLTIFNKSLDYY